jgi:hypothetical protein
MMQTVAIECPVKEELVKAMSSLEMLLNENDPNYIINAIKYYNSHKKIDSEALYRIKRLLAC